MLVFQTKNYMHVALTKNLEFVWNAKKHLTFIFKRSKINSKSIGWCYIMFIFCCCLWIMCVFFSLKFSTYTDWHCAYSADENEFPQILHIRNEIIALFCDFKFDEKFEFSNVIAIFSVLIQLSQGRKQLKRLWNATWTKKHMLKLTSCIYNHWYCQYMRYETSRIISIS